MAIQTQIYPFQDYFYMENINNTNNDLYNDFVFNLRRQQQQQQEECLVQFEDLQENLSLTYYNDFVNNAMMATTTSGGCATASVDRKPPPMSFSHGFAAHLDKHTQEIDRCIVSQNERLKEALQEQGRKQMGEIWRKLEAKAMIIIQEKKQEIAKATQKRTFLEESMSRIEAEKEAWKRIAMEKESMVISLNNTFEQVKQQQKTGHGHGGADDAESWCDDTENNNNNYCRSCQVCKSGEASVVLLPCRHLCCCIACDDFVHVCPLCHSIKKASIQAIFS